VAATPISGPQFNPITTDESWDKEEFKIFTMEIILHCFCFATRTAFKTSAVSPLWDYITTTEFSEINSGDISISLAKRASIFTLAYFKNRFFANRDAL